MEQQKRDLSFYWKLFYATLTLSAFTFGGGGYVIVPLMKGAVCRRLPLD